MLLNQQQVDDCGAMGRALPLGRGLPEAAPGTGMWCWVDVAGSQLAALCLSFSSMISCCRPREEMLLEATAAAGSCVLASSLTELKHTMGWDFFPFFYLVFKY